MPPDPEDNLYEVADPSPNAYWVGQVVLIAVKGSRGQPKAKAS